MSLSPRSFLITGTERLEKRQQFLSPYSQRRGQPPQSFEQTSTIKMDIQETWDLLVSDVMRPLIPLILAHGFSLSIFSVLFVPFMTYHMQGQNYSDQYQNYLALLATVSFGVGEIIGSFIWGTITDKCSTKITILSNLMIFFFANVVLFAFNYHGNFSLLFASLMTFTYGMQDAAIAVYI
jgi:Na+/melibiose symporter-like transporter